MKKFSLCLLALAAFVGFASCDDDKTEEQTNVTLTVAPESLTLSCADTAPQQVTVTTDAASWTAVPESQWIKVERTGGGISASRLLTA